MPQILTRFPQALLVLVGEGPMRLRLQRLAQSLKLGDRVVFAGRVDQLELKYWYSAADVCVLASSREGWANVLLESMACGTPVVATAVGGTPEVVSSAVAGSLVLDRTPSAIASSILRLLDRTTDRAAVRRYAEGFDWRSTSLAQQTLFERLCASPEPSGHA
jgi:glycosyltransferase involved in cell wall biosynthesis